MASTGEVASFGKDIHEAYWAALLSVNGFKLPRPHSGILLGGDINRPEMAVVAANLMRLGFHLYTHCRSPGQATRITADLSAPEVTAHINDQPYLSIKKIMVPVKDKRKLREGSLLVISSCLTR
jgi:carbamoyl-phosphate synthase large subunit